MTSLFFLGFDFYGAGNIGDDLMLKGFLDTFGRHCNGRFVCALPEDRITSQKLRFNQVDWLSVNEEQRGELASSCDCWLGVGGTPFQFSGGPWLLKRIGRDFHDLPDTKKWMIGVGCEEEVLKEETSAKRITSEIEHIWTRDEKGRSLLVDSLGTPSERVTSGGDLAHIALKNIFSPREPQSEGEETVGIVYYAENFTYNNEIALKKFVRRILNDRKVVFLANDVRVQKGFETAVYKKLFGGVRGLIGLRPSLISPNYDTLDISSLVGHYSKIDTVMASRYHAILTAAWAGCRVVALDRSSKIRNLAIELDIPLVSSPFTVETLNDGLCRAKSVSRELLENKADVAEQSVVDLCDRIC